MRVSTGPRPYRPLGNYRLAGGGAFGALPSVEEIIALTGNTGWGPAERGAAILGRDGRPISHAADVLGSGGEYVTNFDAQYKYAKEMSKTAEDDFVIGSPVRNLAKKFDAALIQALSDVDKYFVWDVACGFGKTYWHNCRSDGQVDKLKTALSATRDALKKYADLELAMSKIPPNDPSRSDYMPPVDPGTGTTPAPTTVAPPPTNTVVDKAERRTSTSTYKSSVDTGEKPLWKSLLLYGAPGVAALGLVGALLLKKKRAPLAGYRRRRRRR